MKWCFLFLFMSFFKILSAQDWAPVGAVWYYDVKFPFTSQVTYHTFTVERDTIINQIPSKVLIKRSAEDTIINTYFTYENNGQVYFYNEVIDDFVLLYDFNLLPGQQYTSMVDSCSYQIFIDSTALLIIDTHTFAMQYLNTSALSGMMGPVVKNIGHLRTLLPDKSFFCDGIIVENYHYDGLRCYVDPTGIHINFGIAPSCIFTSIAAVKEISDIRIFPNPARDRLQIEIENSSEIAVITIFNLQGKQLLDLATAHSTTIDLSAYPAGLYFLRVKKEDVVFTKKIVKH